MKKTETTQMRTGFETAFIDKTVNSNLAYKPQFVYNDNKNGQKVLSTIEDELLHCESFSISVAFITRSGVTPFLQTFKELEKKGIHGRIMTTDYLCFSDPVALDVLNSLSNIELRMYQTEAAGNGFHTKGYIFQKDEEYRFIIGSSNMTQDALTRNMEWNTRLISSQHGEMISSVLEEYEKLWNSSDTLPYADFIDEYRNRYEENKLFQKMVREQRKVAAEGHVSSFQAYTLKPNSMQVAFIKNLKELICKGIDRALLISATGTGKTYASAFAMRELGFKRVLFLVHRGQLAKQTKRSYERVMPNSVSMGLIGAGNSVELNKDKDYIFATVQTLSRDEHLKKFKPDDFDCIVLDEAHHSSADTYQKVMSYFKPKLWLGMTATPDKRDDNQEGKNIYEIFNYQIAYEIRLQQAMEEELLCPFHYFGISDLALVDDTSGTSRRMTERDFNLLTSEERVKHIIEQADYYGYSGKRVKGLIFCSRIDESIALSNRFNELGYRTLALNGDASEAERSEAFERLAMDECDATDELQPLDYIFSVEILNEGVDIVEVNQVIMLRPTQSPIVFIQQLGRGLRKAEGKEYVVILDFIGNYANNFMIPIALSGDRTYNKDNIRRYIMEGGRVIPGESTVHFDEISRKRVFEAVDNANFSDIKLLKENYTNLKNKLGRIPALKDFDVYGEMDVLRIFDNKSLGSYYKFLVNYEKEYKIRLSSDEEKVIEFVSKKLASGKRIHELEMFNRILHQVKELDHINVLTELRKSLKADYGREMNLLQEENLVNVMTNEFPAGTGKKTYAQCVFLEKNSDDYTVAPNFVQMLKNDDFYDVLQELVEFGISRYHRDYEHTYADTNLVLYQKYTYEDVCRLLNWASNEVPLNIGGYKFDKKTKTFPVFINYDKEDDISDTTKYEDHFTSSRSLIAISKSGRSMNSDDVQNFLYSKERGIQVELFVRKNKDDKISKEFYYLGRMQASGHAQEFVMPNTTKTAVEIEWLLDVPVREDIYQYIVNA